jgi:hypothetical protein
VYARKVTLVYLVDLGLVCDLRRVQLAHRVGLDEL